MPRILIVEDEPTEQTLLRAFFEGSGHQVYVAPDGEQANKAFLRKDFDIVITDLQTPRVDGLELISSLQQLFPDTPIIAISDKGPGMLAHAKVEGAVAALSKPLNLDELLAAVEFGAPQHGALPDDPQRRTPSESLAEVEPTGRGGYLRRVSLA